MLKIRLKRLSNWFTKAAIVAATTFFGLTGASVLAGTYGSSGYGSCSYGQGCSASTSTSNSSTSSSSSSTSSSSTSTSTPVNLDSYGTSSATAYTITGAAPSQKYTFTFVSNNVTETHTLTVDSIASSSVTVTLASTPQQFTLTEGEQINADLNGDGKPDISMLAKNITATSADISIWRIASSSAPAGISSATASSPTTPVVPKKISALRGLIYALILSAGILLVIKGLSGMRRHPL